MTESIISLKGVSKSYAIQNEASKKFWDLLLGRKSTGELHWALRDINIEIPRGASVGLVGRNGAGKSTLLQLIAGTAQPSTGEVSVKGRVAPLLELGAGFNPDFTGRENVQVAASLVGISASEQDLAFRAIEKFADIGEFIDRPVRTYSSGMFARLAFAVAVHVEPEILLIDEILSVGDMGFQQRCISRLRELREKGVTLIFVSHGPDAIKSVCDRAIFINNGRMVYAGSADETVDRYLSFVREETNKEQLLLEQGWADASLRKHKLNSNLRYGTGHVQFSKIELRGADEEVRRSFKFHDYIALDLTLESDIEIQDLSVSFLIRDSTGVDITGITTFDKKHSLPPMGKGEKNTVRFSFKNIFKPGTYGVSVALNRVSRRDYTDNILLDQLDGAIAFSIVEDPDNPIHYKIWHDIDFSILDHKNPTGGEIKNV